MTSTDERNSLGHLADMEVDVVVELGRRRMSLGEARRMRRGDVIALEKLAGEPVDVRINGVPFADGETVVVDELMVCRITRMRPLPGIELGPGADRRSFDE